MRDPKALMPTREVVLTDPKGHVFAGRYRTTGNLGQGGMGIVYAGVDQQTGREVAIKVLNPGADETSSRRFKREAVAAFGVRHQHLCEVYQYGIEASLPFIVMERLVGETLLERLKVSGRLSVIDSVRITIQVLEALSAAHSTGVIHRDVKPSNVFLLSPPGADPWTKLIDFGVAKYIPEVDREEEAEEVITAYNMVPGTPSYLSPEQLLGERNLDARVDIWAVGVTLFEMLTGRRPFEARTYGELTRRITTEPPARVSLLRPDAPISLERVLAKALAKDREVRYQTADEMRNALVDLLGRSLSVPAEEMPTAPVSIRPAPGGALVDDDEQTTEVFRRGPRS